MLIPKAVQSADVTETCFTTGWSWSCRGDVWLGGDGTWLNYALAAVGQSARRNRDSMEWCLAIFGISWYAFLIIWFFILKQLVISCHLDHLVFAAQVVKVTKGCSFCHEMSRLCIFSLSPPVHHSPFGGHVAATTNQLTCWRIRLPRRGGWGVAGDTCSIVGKGLEETLVYFRGFLGFLGLDGLSSVADFQF